eukprot:485476_1
MSNVLLSNADGIRKRLNNCKQDIQDFLTTGITNDIRRDFAELCQSIHIQPCGISIKCVYHDPEPNKANSTFATDEPLKQEKIIQFTIALEITETLLQFLSIIFGMIHESKIISLCFVEKKINEFQLNLLQEFQKRFEKQCHSMSVHHVRPIGIDSDNDTFPNYLNIIEWKTIQVASFQDNNLNDHHCAVMCQILQNDTRCTGLVLDFNKITSNGCIQLIKHMVQNVPSMLVLSLSYNDIKDDALDELQALIQECGLRNMRLLKLTFNKFTE